MLNRTEEPRLRLHLKGEPRLSLAQPYEYSVEVKLERDRQGDNDKPILFKWSSLQLFGPSGLILLHHTPNGLKPLDIDRSNLLKVADDRPPVIKEWNQNVQEFKPGDSQTFLYSLLGGYHTSLQPGERYTMLWPGDEFTEWDWGTKQEHMGRELTGPSTSGVRLILPGGPHVSFTAEQSLPKVPPFRVEPSDRHPDAPKLMAHLECPPALTLNASFDITLKVTYDAGKTARPITFHTHHLEGLETLRLYRRYGTDWVLCDFQSDGNMGFLIVDEPNVEVNVGWNGKFFVSLQPGESWSTTLNIESESWTELPDDVKNGDSFRCEFVGTMMDWWDWGSMKEHLKTTVELPCFIFGSVAEPSDNDGRPKLAVPTSEAVEFTVVD